MQKTKSLKESRDYFYNQEIEDKKDIIMEAFSFDEDEGEDPLGNFDELTYQRREDKDRHESHWNAHLQNSKKIAMFFTEVWERDLGDLVEDIVVTDKDIKRFGIKLAPSDYYSEGYLNKGSYLNHMSELFEDSWPEQDSNYYKKFSKMWDNIVHKNEELRDTVIEGEAIVRILNEQNQKQYDSAKYFLRSTSLEELDSYLEEGVFGADEESAYDYTAMTLSKSLAEIWDGGIVIQYHAKDIREDTELAPYCLKPQPLGNSSQIRSRSRKRLLIPMSVEYSREREVRMMNGKSIWNDDGTSKIAKIIFSDLGWTETDSRSSKTHDERIEYLKKRYGSLAENLEFHEDGRSADREKYGHIEDCRFVENETNTGNVKRIGVFCTLK